MKCFVGTSGWSYREWRGNFYPDRVPQRDWLRHYARLFPCVEVDSTFYAEPAPSTLDRWMELTPPAFRFAMKVPQSITHDRLLEDCAGDLAHFLGLAERLGHRRGPVILQLPPRFTRSHLPALFRLLEELPERPGMSVEFRHGSCFSTEMFEQLRNRGVGIVTTDGHEDLLLSGPDTVLRLLGDRRQVTTFDRVVVDRHADLEAWAQRIERLPPWVEHAWVFVNNHYSGHSPSTASDLGVRLGVIEPRPKEESGGQPTLF